MDQEQLAFFKARYASMDTEELVDIRRKSQLTEVAYHVLAEELQSRGVATEDIQRIEKELVEASYDEKFKYFASNADRFGARCIDHIAAIAIMVALIAIGKLLSRSWLTVAGIAFWFLYHLFMDSLPYGQSLGKRLTDIAVVSERTHKPCSILQSFVRNLLLIVVGIIDIALMFSERRQRIGDMVAGTIVVRTAFVNPRPS